mmetsp:Transcript_29917/g.75346  ORF Transcript_29917/g.75346 Transcript_29917/m.75346 type:complete len:211 (-) Transcript_29917:1329-1961(-)
MTRPSDLDELGLAGKWCQLFGIVDNRHELRHSARVFADGGMHPSKAIILLLHLLHENICNQGLDHRVAEDGQGNRQADGPKQNEHPRRSPENLGGETAWLYLVVAGDNMLVANCVRICYWRCERGRFESIIRRLLNLPSWTRGVTVPRGHPRKVSDLSCLSCLQVCLCHRPCVSVCTLLASHQPAENIQIQHSPELHGKHRPALLLRDPT